MKTDKKLWLSVVQTFGGRELYLLRIELLYFVQAGYLWITKERLLAVCAYN